MQRAREVIAKGDFSSPPFTGESIFKGDFLSHLIGQDSPRPSHRWVIGQWNRATGLTWTSLDGFSGSGTLLPKSNQGSNSKWDKGVGGWPAQACVETSTKPRSWWECWAQFPSLGLGTFSPATGITPVMAPASSSHLQLIEPPVHHCASQSPVMSE